MINEDIDILSLDNKIKLLLNQRSKNIHDIMKMCYVLKIFLKIENLRPKILLDLLMDKKYCRKKLVLYQILTFIVLKHLISYIDI